MHGETKRKKPDYKIIKNIASAKKRRRTDVFHRELNLVEFNDGERRYDVRGWTDDHGKATRGVMLTEGEIRMIAQAALDYITKKAPGETHEPDA